MQLRLVVLIYLVLTLSGCMPVNNFSLIPDYPAYTTQKVLPIDGIWMSENNTDVKVNIKNGVVYHSNNIPNISLRNKVFTRDIVQLSNRKYSAKCVTIKGDILDFGNCEINITSPNSLEYTFFPNPVTGFNQILTEKWRAFSLDNEKLLIAEYNGGQSYNNGIAVIGKNLIGISPRDFEKSIPKKATNAEKLTESYFDKIPSDWPQMHFYQTDEFKYWTIAGEVLSNQADAIISSKKKADEIFYNEFPKNKYGDLQYETTHMEISSLDNKFKSWRIIRISNVSAANAK